MYLHIKHIKEQYEDVVEYNEDSIMIPQVFEIFGGEYTTQFPESSYSKKDGVMLLGAKNILSNQGYDDYDYIAFVSENTEPLTKIICRGSTSFLVWVKTYTADEVRNINERCIKQLTWKHGNVRDYHIYRYTENYQCDESTMIDFV